MRQYFGKILLAALVVLFLTLSARAQDKFAYVNRLDLSAPCTESATTIVYQVGPGTPTKPTGMYKCVGGVYVAINAISQGGPALPLVICTACIGDGAADDTAAYQAMIDAAPNGSIIFDAPLRRFKFTSGLLIRERKSLYITSFLTGKNFSTVQPQYIWAGGVNGVMLNLDSSQDIVIEGHYFKKSAGTVKNAVNIDGEGLSQISTANIVRWNNFDFSNQANAAARIVALSATAFTNNENMVIRDNNIYCSSGSGAAAVGVGVMNAEGGSANAKHNLIYNIAALNCAVSVQSANGSVDISHVGGGNGGTGIKITGATEPITIDHYESEVDVTGIEVSAIQGPTITIQHSRWSNGAQGAAFIKLAGDIVLRDNNLEFVPGGTDKVIVATGPLSLTSENNSYYTNVPATLTMAKLGFADLLTAVVDGSSNRLISINDKGIIDSPANYHGGIIVAVPNVMTPPSNNTGLYFLNGWGYEQGTITASTPFVHHTATWNNGAIGFDNFTSNITDTASGSTSRLMRLQVNAADRFVMNKSGTLEMVDGTLADPTFHFKNSLTTGFYSPAAGHLDIAAGNLIAARVSNTAVWRMGNRLFCWEATGSFTGIDACISTSATANKLKVTDGSGNAANLQLAQVQVKVYTVATLPTCNGGNEGAIAAVSDALAPAYLSAIAGGGAVHAPVYCNGTNWVAH